MRDKEESDGGEVVVSVATRTGGLCSGYSSRSWTFRRHDNHLAQLFLVTHAVLRAAPVVQREYNDRVPSVVDNNHTVGIERVTIIHC